jgi:uncharacterized protein YjgD (DUF1641 family)
MDTDLAASLDRLHARLDALEQKVDTIGAFARLADRLERIEAMIEAFGTLAERLPVIADAAGTTATWAWQQAEQRGIDPIETGRRAAELGATLARPEGLALAERLLAKRALLEQTLDAIDAVPEEDLLAVAQHGAALTGRLAALLRTPELTRLIEAGGDPSALATAEAATTALVETRKATIEPVGPFGALRKLGDPDVQRAVGFSLALAKRFGQVLK